MKIKYFNKDMPKIQKIDQGDWIDLRVNEIFVTENEKDLIKSAIKSRQTTEWWNNDGEDFIHYQKYDVLIMRLGVAMQLPRNHEAEIKPRSSTFADYGLLLVNSVGCIDELYCGNNDEWLAVYYATRAGCIARFDRVCQFRVNEKMPPLNFMEVETLSNEDRNGFGSTGTK